MPEISSLTKKLLEEYRGPGKDSSLKETAPAISVDEITVRVASFYERIRGIIDWKGEHLLKRNAIERILRRKMFSQATLGEKIIKIPAEPLVTDLIRSGHFENDKIKENKIGEVQQVLDKYVHIIQNLSLRKQPPSLAFYQWLASIAACEIEELLSPSKRERSLISYMYNSLKKQIRIEGGLGEKEKNILLYIAVQQALFNLDPPLISYHLLKYEYKNWKKIPEKELKGISKEIYNRKNYIDSYLKHPLLKKFYRLCQEKNTPYLLIGDILKKDPQKAKSILDNPEILEKEILRHYHERVKRMKGRLTRAATYATISIFITNVAALYALEIPLAKLLNRPFPYEAMAVTIFVPTILMALLIITIKTPSQKNEKKVVMETIKAIYRESEEKAYTIKTKRKKRPILDFVVKLFYAICFAASLGVIVWLLTFVNFPPLSYLIFIIFLSLIAFTGTKVRERSKELYMTAGREGIFQIIIDLFALPVIQLGKWLTVRWEKYNVLSVFFAALIDMPFRMFLEFLEHWRNFLKEKKEEIY